MTIDQFKKIKIDDSPGVYFFQKGKDILYIGKATSLKERVKSYFSQDLIKTRGMLLVDMVAQANSIRFQKTNSVLEALLLETELIKKNHPYYNTKEKDDKSYSYIQITDDEFPSVKIVRGKNIENFQDDGIFGPFLSTVQLRNALKIVRKLFPYRDEKCIIGKNKPCFNYSIGLCPGTCVNKISIKDYKKQIDKIKIFLSGNTEKVLKILEKEMNTLSKAKNFEEAGKIRDKMYAINHINDISLINRENDQNNNIRIEAYDIAHISGQSMIGVMVVMENGEFKKDQYKKFIIKNQDKADDAKALFEVLERRFKHDEWGSPDIIVTDGNKVQLSVAQRFFKDSVSIVKDDKHKAREVLNREILRDKNIKEEDIVKINAEAHRFAIGYFRGKLRKGMFGKK
jgi:excinuclease ABC subunit C